MMQASQFSETFESQTTWLVTVFVFLPVVFVVSECVLSGFSCGGAVFFQTEENPLFCPLDSS